jgi:hypothetical protein
MISPILAANVTPEEMFHLLIGPLWGIGTGLVPLIYARKQKIRQIYCYGTEGFIACLVSGIVCGVLLAAPVCVHMTWRVREKTKARREWEKAASRPTKCPHCGGALSESKT